MPSPTQPPTVTALLSTLGHLLISLLAISHLINSKEQSLPGGNVDPLELYAS